MAQRIFIIAINTFRESVRSKILYSLLLFAALVVGISALFGTVTIGDQIKVIKDFGLFAISIFTVTYAVVSGSTMLYKELERKTIYNVLSKPVRRWEFLLGKFFGMYLTGLLMILLMGIGFSFFAYFFEESINLSLFRGYYHIALQLFIICAAIIFFSSIVVTPVLIGIFSFGLFLAGRSLAILENAQEPILQVIYWLIPHLHIIEVNDLIVYNDAIPLFRTVWATVYAVSYGIILLLIGQWIFSRREFN